MSLPDNNLRKLSTAYAHGLIDTSTYRRLRTEQLSAMEFHRKIPDLSDEIGSINIPKQKLDVPHEPKFKKSNNKGAFWMVLLLIIAAAAGAAYYLQLHQLILN